MLVLYVDTGLLYKRRDQNVFRPFDIDLESRYTKSVCSSVKKGRISP